MERVSPDDFRSHTPNDLFDYLISLAMPWKNIEMYRVLIVSHPALVLHDFTILLAAAVHIEQYTAVGIILIQFLPCRTAAEADRPFHVQRHRFKVALIVLQCYGFADPPLALQFS